MAYPAFKGVGTMAGDGGASVTVGFPATVDDGDIAIVSLLDADNDSFTEPADWHIIQEQSANTNCSVCWMWYRCDGTEDGTTQEFVSALADGQGCFGVIYTFSGCVGDPTTPLEGSAQETVIQDTTYTAPDLVTSDTERLGVTLVNVEDGVAITHRTSWTEEDEQEEGTGGDATMECQTLQIPSDTTISASGGALGGDDYHGSVVFALIPAAGGPAPMSASSDITFTTASDIQAKGLVVAAPDITFTNTAHLIGHLYGAASSDITFTNAAISKGIGRVLAAPDITFTTASDIQAKGRLQATPDITFTNTAHLSGHLYGAASSDIVFSTLAALVDAAAASGDMSASADITFTNAAIVKGMSELVATSVITFTNAAIIKGTTELLAAPDITFSTASTLKGLAAIAASSNITFSNAAHLIGMLYGVAASNMVFTNTAPIKGMGRLQVAPDIIFTNAAILMAMGDLSALSNIVFTTNARIIDQAAGPVIGVGAVMFWRLRRLGIHIS